jgi:hypothetical protein
MFAAHAHTTVAPWSPHECTERSRRRPRGRGWRRGRHDLYRIAIRKLTCSRDRCGVSGSVIGQGRKGGESSATSCCSNEVRRSVCRCKILSVEIRFHEIVRSCEATVCDAICGVDKTLGSDAEGRVEHSSNQAVGELPGERDQLISRCFQAFSVQSLQLGSKKKKRKVGNLERCTGPLKRSGVQKVGR